MNPGAGVFAKKCLTKKSERIEQFVANCVILGCDSNTARFSPGRIPEKISQNVARVHGQSGHATSIARSVFTLTPDFVETGQPVINAAWQFGQGAERILYNRA